MRSASAPDWRWAGSDAPERGKGADQDERQLIWPLLRPDYSAESAGKLAILILSGYAAREAAESWDHFN